MVRYKKTKRNSTLNASVLAKKNPPRSPAYKVRNSNTAVRCFGGSVTLLRTVVLRFRGITSISLVIPRNADQEANYFLRQVFGKVSAYRFSGRRIRGFLHSSLYLPIYKNVKTVPGHCYRQYLSCMAGAGSSWESTWDPTYH